ncbi:MAG: hypothetical protein OHK93_002611 [Ramalina farinacea]|uniref:DUF7896 domain-containing protein n=1 Tax=Ramalina farinacea TaxID=258253 RepID=A0AA43U0I6_9LECA|nr:hypothetical protein [Ramalina farinacea]
MVAPLSKQAKKRRLSNDVEDRGSAMSRKKSNNSTQAASMTPSTSTNPGSSSAFERWDRSDLPFAPGVSNPSTLSRNRRPSKPLAVTTYEPGDYVHQNSITSAASTNGCNVLTTPNQLSLSPYAYSTSPLSSSPFTDPIMSPVDALTDATSVPLSRQTSKNTNSFSRGMENLRLGASMSRGPSNMSNVSNHSFNAWPSPNMAREHSFDRTQLLSHAGGAASDSIASSEAPSDRTWTATNGMEHEQNIKMERTSSAESNAARFSRRSLEQVEASTREVVAAPEVKRTQSMSVSASGAYPTQLFSHDMNRTRSTESQNDKVAIERMPSTRHIPDKIKCPYCDKKPHGFRSEHELRRHHIRAHSDKKTVFVAIDKDRKGFLNDCESCRTHKRYNAYYNCAAHLRRKHFAKKPKGQKRKGKLRPEEKRGAKVEVNGQGVPLDAENNKYSSPTRNQETADEIELQLQKQEQEQEQEQEQVSADPDGDIELADTVFPPATASYDYSPNHSFNSVGMPRDSPQDFDLCMPGPFPANQYPSPPTFGQVSQISPALQYSPSSQSSVYYEASSNADPMLFNPQRPSLDDFLPMQFDMFDNATP